MARVDRTITIEAPVEQVFEHAGDPMRWPAFHALIDRAEQIDSRSYRLSGGSERRPFTYEIEVDSEPARRFSWRYVGRLKGEGFYELTAAPGGTALRMVETLRLNLPVPLRWVVDLLFFRHTFKRDARLQLEKVKRVIEGTDEDED